MWANYGAGMRRVLCTEWGPPERLILEDAPSVPPAAGQVRLGVEAAGVNFVDALFIAGTYQIKVPPPFTPGSELAGRVIEVGEGVERVKVGDLVLSSMGLGAWSSEVTIDADRLTPVPDGVDAETAAAVVQSHCTALFTMTRRLSVAEGETVLVLGAAGGVGLAAIDVATSLGARVVAAVSSEEKAEAARAAGAVGTIDYEREDLKVRAREFGDGGIDVVIDPVGGSHTEPALRALGPGGRLAIIGFAAGVIPSLPVNQILLNNRTVVGVDWGAWAMRNPGAQAVLLDEVLAGVSEGRFRPSTPTVRPLEEAGAVLRDLLERRVHGKVVLTP